MLPSGDEAIEEIIVRFDRGDFGPLTDDQAIGLVWYFPRVRVGAGVIERGIIVNGDVLPGTERAIRDDAAWWAAGERGTRPRGGRRADRLVGHWTAGGPHVGPNAGPKVVRAMRARKRLGKPMDVGVHFVISWDGLVWQTCDLGWGTVHVGNRLINASSVGVECCWPGTIGQAEKLGLDAPAVGGTAHGRRVVCCRPSDELLEAWRWLARAITSAQHPALSIPLRRGGMDKPGVLEHCDVRGTSKVDAAGLLVGALGLAR